jgi:hypothetical protein
VLLLEAVGIVGIAGTFVAVVGLSVVELVELLRIALQHHRSSAGVVGEIPFDYGRRPCWDR